MGVHGLLTYLKEHPRARERRIGLRQLADSIKDKTGGKTAKLLCDFLSVLYWLLGEFHEAKVKRKDYTRFSYLYGGDVVEYEQRFLDFVKALKHLGIEPIFFVDGARGSHGRGFQAKLKTHKARHYGKMERIRRCNLVAEYNPREEVTSYETWFPHPMLPLHILMTLKTEGVKLEHCIGEADAYLARRARSGQEDICGILTGDTDMVMMRGCEVFLCQFFDTEFALGIRRVDFNSQPREVYCDKIIRSTLAKELGIPETELKNLSIICGNDYTSSLNKKWELHEKMDLDISSHCVVESAAKWLRETPHVELQDLPLFEEIDEISDGKYFRAIEYTYEAYEGGPAASDSDTCSSDDADLQGDHPPFFLKGVREGRMTRELLSMVASHPVHWRTGHVEVLNQPLTTSRSCIDDLLLPVRKVIYRLLGVRTVTEYGHFGSNPYGKEQIKVENPSLRLLSNLETRTNLERVCLFTTFLVKAHDIRSLREYEDPIRQARIDCTFTPTLLKSLVVCSALLFSYDLRHYSDSFSPDHVPDVFLVTCFTCIMKKSPRKVHSRPTPEAAEIATGYGCIIEHSYHLASLLGLFEIMPRPAEMYQSAALIPFYAVPMSKPSSIKHQLRANVEMAGTHNTYNYIIQLRSFTDLKALIEEVYRGSKSSLEPFTPHTLLRLVIAFLEVLADVDEADKQNRLFVQEPQSTSYPKQYPRHKKGKKGKKGKSRHKKSTKQVQKCVSGATSQVMGERNLYREEIDKLKAYIADLVTTDDPPTATEDCTTTESDSDDCYEDMYVL